MTDPQTAKLNEQRQRLRAEVFAAEQREDFPPPGYTPQGIDPAFTRAIQEAYAATATGRMEALRLQVDILRRVRLATGPEAIPRSFGAVRLIAPVRVDGQTVYMVDGGLVKLGGWQLSEKETFAKICGLPLHKLPGGVLEARIFMQDHLPGLLQQLGREAALLEAWLQRPAAPEPDTVSAPQAPDLSSSMLDLLQPGFADHLALLFSTILKAARQTPPPLSRIEVAAQRGARLVAHLQEIGEAEISLPGLISVHGTLQGICSQLEQRLAVRFQIHPGAENDQIHIVPRKLHHLLYTLLSGIADGLPGAHPLVGISTRNLEEEGEALLHLEIRDSGGLATFADLNPGLEAELIDEQNELADAYADWLGMAEQVEARLRIARNQEVITRVELFLPLQPATAAGSAGTKPGHRVWLVMEQAEEAKPLRHMLSEKHCHVEWVESGEALQQLYVQAEAPPDLVLVDYLLSDIRGAALRTWLYEQDPDLPVILLSGFAQTHPGLATVCNLPSTLYLQKPFDAQTLYDLLRMTLNETLPGG